jgi:hypothetical protein
MVEGMVGIISEVTNMKQIQTNICWCILRCISSY